MLFRPGFIRSAGAGGVVQYPRYFKALRLRIDRALLAPPKDLDKLSRLEGWPRGIASLVEPYLRSPGALLPRRIRVLVEALEELRIATFAPEIGTRFKISTKRLRNLWDEIHTSLSAN